MKNISFKMSYNHKEEKAELFLLKMKVWIKFIVLSSRHGQAGLHEQWEMRIDHRVICYNPLLTCHNTRTDNLPADPILHNHSSYSLHSPSIHLCDLP